MPAKSRPDVTRKGMEMIGDPRTDALHGALGRAPIEDDTLLALLVLAFAGTNVMMQISASEAKILYRERVPAPVSVCSHGWPGRGKAAGRGRTSLRIQLPTSTA